jgi:GTP-binding protein HflX
VRRKRPTNTDSYRQAGLADLAEGREPGENERAVLVGVELDGARRAEVDDHLGELAQLARTAGADVVHQQVFRRDKPTPAHYVGKGHVERLRQLCRESRADLVIFDDDLSPAQQRNVEGVVQKKVIDRTEIILDIFAQRARTKEAKLQIELAQLWHLLPRLTRRWTHLSRQPGEIGTRGPGETQLEVDRRRVKERIHRLNLEIKAVRTHRATQRKARKKGLGQTASLIGYTNAGKSTLLNALTQAGVTVEDKLFTTLDPTTRKLLLPNHQVVFLSDTVGFIRKLPHQLIDSFRATFEEVTEADLLIHVLDVSDPQADERSQNVYEVLREIGCAEKPTITVLNKIDRLKGPSPVERFRRSHLNCVPMSAKQRVGLDEFVRQLERLLAELLVMVHLRIPQSESRFVSRIHAEGNVISKEYEGNDVLLWAELPAKLAATVRDFVEE